MRTSTWKASPAGRATSAVRELHPGYFAYVMATGIISTGTSLLGPAWLSRALLVVAAAGLAVLSAALVIRLARFRSSVATDIRAPDLWSAVFPLGMYSVATLAYGQAAGISFMAPLARVMIWVAVAAWILVAAAFLRQRARLSRRASRWRFCIGRLPRARCWASSVARRQQRAGVQPSAR